MSQNSETPVRRSLIGRVVSDRMDKTVVVLVERQVKHPLYGKYITRSTKYKVHDEDNSARVGDLVRFVECRPISRHKSHRLVEIVERPTLAGDVAAAEG